MKLTTLLVPVVSLVGLGSAQAVFEWERQIDNGDGTFTANDNLVALNNPGITALDFQIFNTLPDTAGEPAIGVDVGVAGDSAFDFNVSTDNSNPNIARTRFTVVVPPTQTDLSFVTFNIDFSQLVAPRRPTETELDRPLVYLQESSQFPIEGALGLRTQGVTVANPTVVNGSFDTNNNFTLTPTLEGRDGGAGVQTLSGTDDTPGLAGFTLTVRPEGGGNFEPRTRFIVTLDGLPSAIAVIPEPTSGLLVLLGSLTFLARRKR